MSEVAPRTCTQCKKGMWEGYCIDSGHEYFCTDACLHKKYSKEEWGKMYRPDGESYWTQWTEDDIE